MPRRAPVSRLSPWQWDHTGCHEDVTAFEHLLATAAGLSERDEILPFFRTHADLAALLGTYHPNITAYDRLGVEVQLFGEFVADVVVGDSSSNAVCLIEFEDGRPNSMFVPRQRRATEWAPRFEHGFSQIVDWLWLLDDQEASVLFEDQFGPRPLDVTTLLVAGRDSGVSPIDRRRLQWRRTNVVVNSHHIYCCTFDDLVPRLRNRLRIFKEGAAAE